MSIRQSASIFKSLSEDQKHFIDTKTIGSALQVREWTGFLRKAALYDELRDKAIKTLNIYIILIVIGFIGSLFVISYNPVIAAVLIVLFIILFVIFLIQARKISKRDLSDHLRKFVLPLLFVLDKKAGSKAKLQLKMDLTNPLKKAPVKEFKHGEKNIKVFSQQYVMGKVKLLDEAVMEWVISDDIQTLKYWKTSASGKRKLKTKYKVAHYFFIKISFPKKSYTTKNGVGDSVRLSENDEFFICKTKSKVKSEDPKNVIELEEFLKSINELYSLINAKPGTKFPEEKITDKNVKRETDDDDDIMEDDYDIVPFMVWHHVYFTDHDYDGFTYEGGYDWDDSEGGDSFFDS